MAFFKLFDIKRKKTEKYINVPAILKLMCHWYFIFGGRDTGKSYGFKYFLLKQAYEPEKEERDRKHRFMYIRAYDEDVTNNRVYNYFKDMITNNKGEHPIEELTGGKYKSIRVVAGKIFLINVGPDGKDIEKPFLVGYYDSLNMKTRLKSQSWLDIDYAILEEFMNENRPQQCEELVSIISTVARSKFIQVFCIGNNEVRDNAWFRFFELKHAMQQEKGTAEVYEFENGDVDEYGKPVVIRVASCYCEDATTKGMFYGEAAEINNGDYRAKKKPTITLEELKKYQKIYTVYFRRYWSGWCADLYIDEVTGGLFWHVREHKKVIPNGSRVVSDKMNVDPLYTMNLQPFNELEKLAFEQLRNGKVYYTDNLTGTEFEAAIKHFAMYNIFVDS